MAGKHRPNRVTRQPASRHGSPNRPMPGVVGETNTSGVVWPGPESADYGTKYADMVDKRLFHVDYLLETFQDFARPNLYKVEFDYDPAFSNKYSFLSDDSRLMTEMTAKTVNIPSFEIGKQEIKRCGERLFLPTTQNFGDLQMTLMCDDDYTQRKFLHSWMKHMVYDTDYNFYHKVKITQSVNLIVHQLDNNYNIVFSAKFGGAWPHAIGEIQLSFDSDGQVVEFPATFCYSTYTILSNNQD